MEWLNYHHLLYFWTVVQEGGVARASTKLRLAQPTVSGQVRALEEALGEKLFQRVGRKLELTEVGQLVYRYADEIFSVGRELQDALKGRPTRRPQRLAVGVADVVPKLIAYRILEPALRLPEPVRLDCDEDAPDRLLAALSLHELDVVLSDTPAAGASARVRVYSHLLGECGVTFFAAPRLAATLRSDFPRSLTGAPFLMPRETTPLRRALQGWLEEQDARPNVVAEFKDSALLEAFGQAGAGVFAAPSAIEAEVRDQYGVQVLGRTESVRERFYVITVERRLRHPAVLALTQTARTALFPPKT